MNGGLGKVKAWVCLGSLSAVVALTGCKPKEGVYTEDVKGGGLAVYVDGMQLPDYWEGMPYAVWYDQAFRVDIDKANVFIEHKEAEWKALAERTNSEPLKAFPYEHLRVAKAYRLQGGPEGYPVAKTGWQVRAMVWECAHPDLKAGAETPSYLSCDNYKSYEYATDRLKDRP